MRICGVFVSIFFLDKRCLICYSVGVFMDCYFWGVGWVLVNKMLWVVIEVVVKVVMCDGVMLFKEDERDEFLRCLLSKILVLLRYVKMFVRFLMVLLLIKFSIFLWRNVIRVGNLICVFEIIFFGIFMFNGYFL